MTRVSLAEEACCYFRRVRDRAKGKLVNDLNTHWDDVVSPGLKGGSKEHEWKFNRLHKKTIGKYLSVRY